MSAQWTVFSDFLQPANILMTNLKAEGSKLTPRFLAGAVVFISRDCDLQAFRHREGMRKNWRLYRRGCERRFIFRPSSGSLPSRGHRSVTCTFHINCYNFCTGQNEELVGLPANQPGKQELKVLDN